MRGRQCLGGEAATSHSGGRTRWGGQALHTLSGAQQLGPPTHTAGGEKMEVHTPPERKPCPWPLRSLRRGPHSPTTHREQGGGPLHSSAGAGGRTAPRGGEGRLPPPPHPATRGRLLPLLAEPALEIRAGSARLLGRLLRPGARGAVRDGEWEGEGAALGARERRGAASRPALAGRRHLGAAVHHGPGRPPPEATI